MSEKSELMMELEKQQEIRELIDVWSHLDTIRKSMCERESSQTLGIKLSGVLGELDDIICDYSDSD